MIEKRKSIKFLGVFLLISIFLVSCSIEQTLPRPGIQLSAPISSVEHLANVIKPFILQRLGVISVPEISGTESGFSYTLSNIRVPVLNFDTPAVTIVGPNILDIDFQNIDGRVSLNWRYSRRLIVIPVRDSGTATVTFAGNVKIRVSLSIDPSQRNNLRFTVISMNVNFTSFNVRIEGTFLAFLYNLILRFARGRIRDAIKSEIERRVPIQIQNFSQTKINALSPIIPVGPANLLVSVNLRPVLVNFNAPLRTVTIGVFGSFLHRGAEVRAGSPQLLPTTVPCNRMGQIIVSAYSLNSLIVALFNANALQATILDRNIPSGVSPRLTPESIRQFIPQLPSNIQNVRIRIFAARAPNALIRTTGIEVTSALNLVLEGTSDATISATSRFQEIFSATVSSTIEIFNTRLVSQRLVGSVRLLTQQATITNSNAGPIADAFLRFAVERAFENGLIPLLNLYASLGIPLNIDPSLSFSNAPVVTRVGHAFVCTDFNYRP